MKNLQDVLPANARLLRSGPGSCAERFGKVAEPGYALVLNHGDEQSTQSIAWIPTSSLQEARAVIESVADGTPVDWAGGEVCSMYWIKNGQKSEPTGTLSRRNAGDQLIDE